MIDAVNVLQIEDSETVVQLTRSMLADANGATIELESVESLSEGIKRVARGGIDVVLLDLILPDSQGLDTFRILNAAAKVPIVIFTSVDDEEQSLVALREGAADYLIKSEVTPKWLTRSLRYAVSRAHHLSADAAKERPESTPIERLIEIDQRIHSLGEDADGELYVLTTAQGIPVGKSGKVWRLVPTAN